MTNAREVLVALVGRWRELADGRVSSSASSLLVCADELESLLASAPSASQDERRAFRSGWVAHKNAISPAAIDTMPTTPEDAWDIYAKRVAQPPNPIAAAVDAQLDPLKDELITIGRKLAQEETR